MPHELSERWHSAPQTAYAQGLLPEQGSREPGKTPPEIRLVVVGGFVTVFFLPLFVWVFFF